MERNGSKLGTGGAVVDLRESRPTNGAPVLQPRRPDVPEAVPPASRRRALGIAAAVILAAMAVGAGIVLWRQLRVPATPGILEASGRIEGRITTVTPKALGRVARILVDEGRQVSGGQVLAVLDDQAQLERMRAAQEHVRSLEEHLRSVETQLAVSTAQVPLQISQAQDALNQAESGLAQARANAAQASKDADRDAALHRQGLIAAQPAEISALRARVTAEGLRDAEANLARTQKGLSLAQLGIQQLDGQRKDRDSLDRQVRQAQAVLAEQESYVADFTIRSPLDGTVLTRNIELGEHVGPAATLFTVVDLNQLYLKVYVPEPDIGRVILGQDARVYVDAYPGRPFAARVNRIYQSAEFTPKNVETKEERVKLVFPVELLLVENSGGRLKPGMPADGFIRVDPSVAWPAPAKSRAGDGGGLKAPEPTPARRQPSP